MLAWPETQAWVLGAAERLPMCRLPVHGQAGACARFLHACMMLVRTLLWPQLAACVADSCSIPPSLQLPRHWPGLINTDLHSPAKQAKACPHCAGNVSSWLTDADFKIRGCVAVNNSNGDQTLRVRDSADPDAWRDLIRWPQEEDGGPVSFAKEGDSMYVRVRASPCASLQLVQLVVHGLGLVS